MKPLKKIGLYGGSFDPVHLGHLLVAQAALEELNLDRLFFIPAWQSPFKPDRQSSPAAVRLRLLRLALHGCNDYEIDEQEVGRQGVSYTIDTIRNYQARMPDAEIHYLIGADHVAYLEKWRDASELARAVSFCVIPRPGVPQLSKPGFRLNFLNGFPIQISSSMLRARVKAGHSIRHLVPLAVEEAIRKSGLYI